ncbi:hypothetical protein LPW11_19950 [Geomonas sp. RF6]|uniref:hypothetical protein n=1 Tax=Geomonas sp. RF6 TaxID=2897342 RepID=UPI001E348100|nr:hypothetical protein [Geomonas sp. RF6]UFS70134.1 hypothetical protein LPW11_19950 [Geomonas sp. RF6]
MKRSIVLTALLIVLTSASAQAAEPAPAETAQSLYLQAGKAERQDQQAKAKELYEAIIDRFPTSDLALNANDRLLELMRGTTTAPSTKPTPPPPADPKAKARELLALKKKAADIQDKEWRRLSIAFFNRYDHRYNRSELRENEQQWDKLAEEKVREELGMGSAEINARFEEACHKLGITGTCDEKALK